MSVHPYLFFTNTCRAAMTRYHEILGGELEIMTVADMPADAEPPPFEFDPQMVIHAALTFADGDMIMASDDPTGDAAGTTGVAISLSFTDHDEVRRVYDALADGGEVTMPLGETFWAPLFGMCTDRFGVSWMVGADAEEPS
ncbi:MAG: VOC family protein [Acidimicrobiia bacterium]